MKVLQLKSPGLSHCISQLPELPHDAEINSKLLDLAPIPGHGTVERMLMTKWEHISMKINSLLRPFSAMSPKEIVSA